MTTRKGARSTKDISPGLLKQLNHSELETANLVEWLAVDQNCLLKTFLQQQRRERYLDPVLVALERLPKRTVNTVNEAIGLTLLELAQAEGDKDLVGLMASHRADLVRCWATYIIGRDARLDLSDSLSLLQPFAADTHFGVREICWIAVRPKITAQLTEAIELLTAWTKDADANIRRFATESTRPRGVWCAHIEALKREPILALPLLEALRADPARYVQDSVGNWLNDASKSQPQFVIDLCTRWEVESKQKETTYIIKKALRTLHK